MDEASRLRADAITDLGLPAIDVPWEEPPERHGDVAFACFLYAKEARRDAEELATRIAAAIRSGRFIQSAAPAGGYVNLTVEMSALAAETAAAIAEAGEDYGSGPVQSQRILLEHTSVNPTGPMNPGRARNPIIGDALARTLRRAGFSVTTEYLVNDAGKQIVLLYWGVTHLRPQDVSPALSEKGDLKLLPYYVKANELAEQDRSVGEEVQGLIRRFEGGDAALTLEIRKVARRVLDGILETLRRLGVRFDTFFWETDLILQGKVAPIVQRLAALPETKVEDGAYNIDMAPFGVKGRDTKWFLTKKDGTTLYATRDIAYHLDKFARCDVAINVLGENHRLEYQQLRVALRLLDSRDVEAVFYAYVSLPEGGMSTRRGRLVTMDELLEEAVARAHEEVRKRRPELSEARMREIAETVGIAAVRYNIVRVQSEKKITFRWEDALNFEGNSAPFVQYAHARACGILEKAGPFTPGDPVRLAHPEELKLAKLLSKLPSLIQEAAKGRRPHILATYVYDVASQFNQFYRDCPVLQAEAGLREARLALVDGARIVLRNAMDCLGLSAPREM